MNSSRSILVSLFVLPFTFLQAQTADEIVNKHVDAIGGKAVIEKIKSLIIHSDLSVMGTTLTSVSTTLVGKGFKNVANFNGQEIIQVVTPTGGWMVNPLAGQTDPQPLPDDQVKAAQSALDAGSDLFNYTAKGSKVELVGRETVEGVNTYKLKLVDKDSKATFYFLDPTTYYIIKREATTNINGEDVTAISTFSNYKKTDFGLVIPYTTISNQGFEITISVTNVEFNKEVDPKIFEMPK
jgi:outer membrane lipoprotein-sorting protein